MSDYKQKIQESTLEDDSVRHYPNLLIKASVEEGFSFGANNLDQYWQRTHELNWSDDPSETYADVCPKRPMLEYNGTPFVATTDYNKLGLFHIAPVGVPHIVKVLDNNYVIHKVEVETESHSNKVKAIHKREVLLDTKDANARNFILKLTILTVESNYNRYTEDNFLGYLVDTGREHKKIRRLARILHHWTKNRKEFTEPLLIALNSGTLDQFYDVLTAKINFYLKKTSDFEQFTLNDKEQELSTISPVLLTKKEFRTCLISADWYIDLLENQIDGGSLHQADYVHEATWETNVQLMIQATQDPLISWSEHGRQQQVSHQASRVLETVQQGDELHLSKVNNSTLFIESKRLVEHWGLTTDKVKDILSQQGSAYIFDIAKHLICSYTSDPKIYTEKRLIVDRGYKGFTERLSDEYSTKFNEMYVKESLHWWDSVRIRHGNTNVPAQTIFTLDGRPSKDQLLINYGQAITDPASKRLVPILNHPQGKKQSRVLWNKLGLALSSFLVDNSSIYQSNASVGVPFGPKEIDDLKTLVNASQRRTILRALDAFKEAEAIELNDGFLKLGSTNTEQELTIFEGASRSLIARKHAQKRTKVKDKTKTKK